MATASLKSAVQLPSGQWMTAEDFQVLLTSGTDEVMKRGFDTSKFPFQMSMFYDDFSLNKASYTFQDTLGTGNIPRNRDGQTLTYEPQSLGFAHSWSSVQYRKAIGWTRELLEDELYGQLTDNSEELMTSSRRTVELIAADGVNRAMGPSGAAPVLCNDGGYWLDTDRPNPNPTAGTWSNVESTGAVSQSSIWTAALNFRLHKNSHGDKEPIRLSQIIIRPQDEPAIKETLMSTLRPTDSMNAINYLTDMGFTYSVYDHMTAALIMYRATGMRNEVKALWRVRPNVAPVNVEDPDTFAVRVRFRFGLGLGRPDIWRGGAVS